MLCLLALLCLLPAASGLRAAPLEPVAALAALETSSGGRLGVFAFEPASGRTLGHRADQRFGLCSTFKLPLAALVLRAGDADTLDLDQLLAYTEADLVPHAPVTSQHLAAGGMRIVDLAQATQTTSDNVAANLLMRQLGGPTGVTTLLRELGDTQTRLDRWEPEMNLVTPGEVRDTTTPQAMAHTVHRLFDGDTLSPASTDLLRQWMIATTTGKARLRAGLPGDWIVGDKTGTGIAADMANKHNDVAVVWSGDRPVLIIAAYFEADGHYDHMRPTDDAVLAQVGRVVADWHRAGR